MATERYCRQETLNLRDDDDCSGCLRGGRSVAIMGLFGLLLCQAVGGALGQTLDSPCVSAPPLPITGTRTVNVATEAQLQSAMRSLRDGDTILLANGTYNLTNTLYVSNVNNVTIRGASGCDNVVLVGRGMDNANYGNVPHGVWSNARNTVIAHLTIRDIYTHPIIFNAGAQSPHVYNVKLLNAGSQFIKANPHGPADGVDNGVVEYSVFEYTAGPSVTDHGPGVGYTNGYEHSHC